MSRPNQYDAAEQAELEDQAEFLRHYDPHIIEEDGWEVFTRILVVLLILDGIALIWNWK